MVRADDFLEHARSLVRENTEIDHRRAISAAYYAMFHMLTGSGARLVTGNDVELASDVARGFEHSTMLKVCRELVQQAKSAATDPSLILVAQLFIDLQAARHQADYDLAATVLQARTERLIRLTVTIMADWPRISTTREGTRFLLKLLLGSRLGRRG